MTDTEEYRCPLCGEHPRAYDAYGYTDHSAKAIIRQWWTDHNDQSCGYAMMVGSLLNGDYYKRHADLIARLRTLEHRLEHNGYKGDRHDALFDASDYLGQILDDAEQEQDT